MAEEQKCYGKIGSLLVMHGSVYSELNKNAFVN